MSERKIHNFESIILSDFTLQNEGYNPDKFGPSSAKFIWASCRFCGQPSRIRKGFFNKAGSACHKECRLKEQSISGSPFNNEETRIKAKEKIQERYGHEYASQNLEIAQKISNTKKENSPKVPPKQTLNLQVNIKPASEVVEPKSLVRKQQHILFKIPRVEFNKKQIVCEILDELQMQSDSDFFDIFISDFNFAIEVNDNYESCEAFLDHKVATKKHISKTKLCRENGIRLLHIFEHQWPSRKKQLLNFIKTILGKNVINVPARKCLITHDRCDWFIDSNHIQGKVIAKKYFNLVYNGEIVASMTASDHHRQNVAGNPIILSRLCFKDGMNVQGGSSKLFKYFKEWAKESGYDHIISWSDNCWTDGGIYKVLGFTLVREYDPDYFYWDIKNHRHFSKQSQRKKATGCPVDKTEREWCMERGLYRVWDCGKKLWTLNLV